MTKVTKIGWIGAGKMGLPICKRLQSAGFDVTALARNAERASELQEAGLQTSDSIRNIAAASDIVFVSITDDLALHDVVFASGLADAMNPSTIFIDISTVSPAASAKVATKLAARKVSYLRSPVSGSTGMAEAGTLTAMVSGPEAAFNALPAVFAAFTRSAFYLGAGEEARYLKLAVNSMVAATSALLGEALAFGKKGGLTNAAMLEVITQSAVASPLIGYKKDMIINGDYKPAATLNMLAKDVDVLLATASALGLALPINTNVSDVYEQAIDQGLGEKDFFVLVQEAERLANISGKGA
jgi:3-hydroxyisobutyrate dehydrogenase-like beta-hydroxyacid dehydrogenase